MKKIFFTLILTSPFWLVNANAQQDHRLAFSKAANIEIFVKDADSNNWCTDNLNLLVKYHGLPDQSAFEELMPKLGALFAQNCPNATQVSWESVDINGNHIANGTSAKSIDWLVVTAQEPSKPTQNISIANSTPPGLTKEAETAASTETSTDATTAALTETSTDTSTATPTELTNSTTETKQDKTNTTNQPTIAKTQTANIPTKPASLISGVGPADFTVKGWKPESQEEALSNLSYVTDMVDQYGCKYHVITGYDEARLALMNLKTDGLTCNATGYGEGKGKAYLERVDGKVDAQITNVYASNGFIFSKPVKNARLIHANTNGKYGNMWFDLGHNDDAQSYYTIHGYTQTNYKIDKIYIDDYVPIHVVTEDIDNFIQAKDITEAIERTLEIAQTEGIKSQGGYNLLFGDSLDEMRAINPNNMFYKIEIGRKRGSTREKPTWHINLNNAKNFAIPRKQKLLEEQAKAEALAKYREKLISNSKNQIATSDSVDFEVADWKPKSDLLNNTKTIESVTDQNGCKLYGGFIFSGNKDHYSVETDGLSCGDDGLANGIGSIKIVRSDGEISGETKNIHVSDGFIFNQQYILPKLVDIRNNGIVWFDLGADNETKSRFLLMGQVFNNKISPIKLDPKVVIFTENIDTFRKAENIKSIVNKALNAYQTVANPDAYKASIIAATSLDGVASKNRDDLIYAIDASKDRNYSTNKPVGDWQYNLNRGHNYLFEREEKLAREEHERKIAEERARIQQIRENARIAETELALYEKLVSNTDQKPYLMLYSALGNKISFNPSNNNRLASFYNGGTIPFANIVHITKVKDGLATVDLPYDLRIETDTDLKSGWYIVRGEARADQDKTDAQGLPLTIVSIGDKEPIVCSKTGCEDIADPINLVRLQLNKPDWEPEQAMEQIKSAQGL